MGVECGADGMGECDERMARTRATGLYTISKLLDSCAAYSSVESARLSVPPPMAAPRLGRRTALTLPLFPPPQKKRSAPSDSSPDTHTPGGISSCSRTLPLCGSIRRNSLCSPSHVPCQSSPSTQVTPVTKRLDSMVRRIAPVAGIDLMDLPVPILPDPQRTFGPRQPRIAAAARCGNRGEHAAASSDRSSGCAPRRSGTGARPSKAVPASAATAIVCSVSPLAGSKAFSLSPAAIQTR